MQTQSDAGSANKPTAGSTIVFPRRTPDAEAAARKRIQERLQARYAQTSEEGIAAREAYLEKKYQLVFDKTDPLHGKTYAEAARWGATQTRSPLSKQLFLRLAEVLEGVHTRSGAGRVYATKKPGVDSEGFKVTGRYSPYLDCVLTPAKSANSANT